METLNAKLLANADFRRLAAGFSILKNPAREPAIAAQLEALGPFAAARRRRASEMKLASDSGEAQGLVVVLDALREQAKHLQPLLSPQLDEIIALAGDAKHPMRQFLVATAKASGFSRQEVVWLLGELEGTGYRPVALLCEDGFEDVLALISAVSTGDSGQLNAGFLRFTGDERVDSRTERLVLRFRERGVTASVFLVILVLVVAEAVSRARLTA